MKFPKLYLACSDDEYSPRFGYAFVTKENTVATTAHILVKHKASDLFKDDFITSLPDNGIMIPINALRLICRKSTTGLLLSDDKQYIELMQKDGSVIRYNCQPGHEFPKYDHLFYKIEDCKPLSKIAVSAIKIYELAQAMDVDDCVLRFHFYGPTKAIIVIPNRSDKDVIGLIMPCMINE